MRRNLPVTGREFPLAEDDLIISRTDLKGFITWANPDFIRISGFEPSELMDKPHNVLRHPDMPPAAFKDLWDTVKAGRAWTGIVKNRRKDGDHYWVQADVTPIREAGRIVGYTSIRGKPTAEQVRFASTLYADINAGKASLAPGWKLSVQLRLMGLTFLAVAFGLAAGLAGPAHPFPALALLGAGLLLAGWGAAPLLARISLIAAGLRAADYRHDIPVQGHDEVAEIAAGINVLHTRFHRVMQELKRTGRNLRGASEELKEGNLELSRRTEAQAAALEETGQGLHQIGEAVELTARQAGRVLEDARGAQDEAVEGGKAVEALNRAVEAAHTQSARILEIANVVDELAFQTNLLALNAAVEAARAGEHGRGFAVVAGEVRALAGRSSDSAKEIRTLLKGAETSTREATGLAQHAGQRIRSLQEKVSTAGGAIQQIATATQSQSRGLSEIRKAMEQMETLTHRNAALVEEAAARAEELDEQAKGLEGLVACFVR
ncbi:MAG TPA: PAS domain-containing methyl-accepting chemotaxis protein [Holophagaceae bacterium]|nr:PAS domain-containing methyl-accepting chemotaxis protein [Holophagaceae bacterium]